MTPALQVIDLITTDEGRKFAPAGRMAASIIEIIQHQGDCLPQDLNAKGYTPDEVAEHWHMAYALAKVEVKFLKDDQPIRQTKFKQR